MYRYRYTMIYIKYIQDTHESINNISLYRSRNLRPFWASDHLTRRRKPSIKSSALGLRGNHMLGGFANSQVFFSKKYM